jgi:exodeoxyribonuclease VII small subunit
MKKSEFEKSILKLEEIVKKLENGELELEEAMAKFEEGINLVQNCIKILDKTEKKIEILTRDTEGALVKKDFKKENNEK